MKKDDIVYLRHIPDALEAIEKYTEGMSEKEFHPIQWHMMRLFAKSRLLGKPPEASLRHFGGYIVSSHGGK